MKIIFIINKMIVCLCKAVSDRDVARAIEEGADTIEKVARRTGAGTGCGQCLAEIGLTLDMAKGKIAKPRIVLPVIAALTP